MDGEAKIEPVKSIALAPAKMSYLKMGTALREELCSLLEHVVPRRADLCGPLGGEQPAALGFNSSPG
jgi:hypothetical protein